MDGVDRHLGSDYGGGLCKSFEELVSNQPKPLCGNNPLQVEHPRDERKQILR
jgi:hypothetical protein